MTKAKVIKTATTLSTPDDYVKLAALTKDGYYDYKVKYLFNPVKVANDKTFIVEIQVATSPFVRPAEKTFTNFNPRETIRALQLRSALQKDLINSQKNKYIFSIISDLTKRIPNDRTLKFGKGLFTDVNFFTKKLKIKPALLSDLERQNLSLPVLDVNRNSLEESNITFSSNDFRLAASTLLRTNKKDPAQIAGVRSNNYISAARTTAGTISNKTPKEQTESVQGRMLVGSFLNTKKITNHAQLAGSVYANIFTKEESEYIEVEETLKIPVGDLEGEEFYLIYHLKDAKGLTRQTINRKVSHSKNVAELEIPVLAPDISALSTGQLGRTALDIKQKDPNAISVNIYRRELNQTSPALDATYDFVGQADIDSLEGIKRVDDIFASTNPVIYRAVPVNGSGILGAEFGSIVVKQQRGASAKTSPYLQRPRFISIVHDIQENGIVLTMRDYPPEPITMRILRKDLSIKEQNYTQVGDITLIGEDTNIPIVFEDTQVKPDRIYEYSVEFTYKDGATVLASNRAIIEYSPIVSNVVQLNITEPEVIQGGDVFDAVFNIEKELIQSDGDLIKSFLTEQGLLPEYQEQLISNRDKLQDLFAVRVTRTNINTGEVEDFGVVQPGEFSDKKFGKVKSVKPLMPGFDYKYSITAHARDPETLFTTLEKTVTNSKNRSYVFKPFNFRHPVTLTKGNIVSENSLKRNHAKTTFTFGQVVDMASVEISLSDVLPSLYDGKVNLFGSNDVLVQWKVQGNANKFDHFIIILESMGARTIVGKSHNITNNNSFQFVDKLTNKECGELTYYIVPVFFDFSRGPELKTNQVLV